MWIGNKEVSAMMLDLSGLGIAIVTDYDIPIWSVLSIRFTLINLHTSKEERVRLMEMTGEVRNNVLLGRNKHRLGISFTHIDKKDQYAIDRFVKMTMNQ